MSAAPRELAFYYPNSMWANGDWIKNLVLFFDGIALLVPNYMKQRPQQLDHAIVVGLQQHGLLEIIEPEKAVDRVATQQLAGALTDIITAGTLDHLSTEATAFHELSMSRLGAYGDPGLYSMIFDELKARGLAKDSADGRSIPMHPHVRSLVLVLLSQILRPYGAAINATLSPATDMTTLVRALADLLSIDTPASTGTVVEFDLNTVAVDLGPVPIDEALAFRKENLAAHRHYMLSARKFAMELSRMPVEERQVAFDLRQAELHDLASGLRKNARKAWKKPAAFGLTLAGTALSAANAAVAAAVRVGAGAVGYDTGKAIDPGAYSYLFKAHGRYGY